MYTKYAELRDSKHLTDAEIAKETGITPSTFSDWKAGRYTPKVDKLLKVAAVLGVSVEELLKGD